MVFACVLCPCNDVDSDEIVPSVIAHLGLHYFPRLHFLERYMIIFSIKAFTFSGDAFKLIMS